ncbi:MAG: hypothetical protein FVQ80_06095 [Planctomycetes bacterium]|nr:hypothetical protein [Planctomycetota bacterium]
MSGSGKGGQIISLFAIGLFSWIVPGGGYFLLGKRKRALILFLTIVITFSLGLYVGSVGVVDPVGSKPWYFAQIMTSPMVILLGQITVSNGYVVYGKPSEIGQIYTSIAGLLNLLCLINAVYLGNQRNVEINGVGHVS